MQPEYELMRIREARFTKERMNIIETLHQACEGYHFSNRCVSSPALLDAERTKHVKNAHQYIKREVITCLVLLEEELRSKAGQAAFEALWASKHYQSLRDFLEV